MAHEMSQFEKLYKAAVQDVLNITPIDPVVQSIALAQLTNQQANKQHQIISKVN